MATILKNNIKPGGSTLKGLVATDASGNQRDVKFVRQVDVNGVATTLYDTFDHYEYSEITITANHTYNGDVGANGSAVAVASAPTYKQTRWSVGASGAKYEETTLTTGATITYSGTHVAADGTVSGSSLGTTEVARNTNFASSVATVSMNGKSVNTSGVSVAQAANAKTGTGNYNGKTQACYQSYTEYQVVSFASVGDIPAYGGSSYAQGTGQSRTNYKTSSYTKYEIHDAYTSGDHKHNGTYTTSSGWTDGSAPSASAWGGNTTVEGSTVSGTSLGTTTTSAKTNKGNSTTTWNGVSCSAAIYQAINAKSASASTALNGRSQACYKAYTEYQIINFVSAGDVPAKGGSSYGKGTGQSRTNYSTSSYTKYDYYFTWTAYAGDSNAKQYSYTSTASGWTDGSAPAAGAWGGNTAVTGSTVNGSNLTTNQKARTSLGNSTVTWNGKTASVAIYQAANTYSDAWNAPSITAFTYNSTSFACTGGTATVSSKTASQSGTRTWTSTSTQTITNSTFTWSFSGSATGFSVNTSTGAVTVAANNGAARSITVTATVTGAGKTATKTATISQAVNPTNGYEYVNLGLPSGLKWAKCNIGATTETGYGNYYQWGSLTPRGTDPYESNNYYSGSTIDSAHDIVVKTYGGSWRMPTINEVNELLNNTTKSQYSSTVNSIKTVTFTSNNNTLRLPTTGYHSSGKINNQIRDGYYWTVNTSNGVGYCLYFTTASSNVSYSIDTLSKQYGVPVRGVIAI